MSETKTYSPEDRQRIGKLLAALATMSPAAAQALIETFDVVPLTTQDRRYINGPIIVHETGGYTADAVPSWMFPQVRAERLEIILGLQPDMIVGPTEIAAVMHNASLVAPLNHYASELYLWAASHAKAKYENCDREAVWAKVASDTPMVTDDMVLRRGGRLYMEYRELAEEIRRKVAKEMSNRARVERLAAMAAFFRKEPTAPISEAPPPVAIAAE